MTFDITKKHQSRMKQAIANKEELDSWEKDLVPRIKKATDCDSFKEKLEALSEGLLFLATKEMRNNALKMRAMAVLFRDKYGLTDEELNKWLSGNNLIPQTCSQMKSKTP